MKRSGSGRAIRVFVLLTAGHVHTQFVGQGGEQSVDDLDLGLGPLEAVRPDELVNVDHPVRGQPARDPADHLRRILHPVQVTVRRRRGRARGRGRRRPGPPVRNEPCPAAPLGYAPARSRVSGTKGRRRRSSGRPCCEGGPTSSAGSPTRREAASAERWESLSSPAKNAAWSTSSLPLIRRRIMGGGEFALPKGDCPAVPVGVAFRREAGALRASAAGSGRRLCLPVGGGVVDRFGRDPPRLLQ